MTKVSARAGRPAGDKPAFAAPTPPDSGPMEYAFVVRDKDGQYYPARLTLKAGSEVHEEELHPPTPYKALAYEYLQGDVAMHYAMLAERQG